MVEEPRTNLPSSKRSSLPSFSSREIPSSLSVSVRRQSFQTQPSEISSERKKDSPFGLQRTLSLDSVKSDSEESSYFAREPKHEGIQSSNNSHPYQIVSSSSAVLSRGNPSPKKSWTPTHRSTKSLSSMPSDPLYRPRPLPTPPHATLPPFPTPVHMQFSSTPSGQAEKRGVRSLARKWEERGSSISEASSADASEAEETRLSDHSQSKRRSRSLDEQIVLKDPPIQIPLLSPSQTCIDKAYSSLPPSPPISTSSSSDIGSPPSASLPVLAVGCQPSRYSTLSRSTNRTRPKRSSESSATRPCADSDCDSDEEDGQLGMFRRNVTARPPKVLISLPKADMIDSKRDDSNWTAQGSNVFGKEDRYGCIIQGLTTRIEALEERLLDLERKSMVSSEVSDSQDPPSSAITDVLSSTTTTTPFTSDSSTLSRAASSTKDQSDRKRGRPVYGRDIPGYLILVSIGVSIVTWEVLWRRFVRGRG